MKKFLLIVLLLFSGVFAHGEHLAVSLSGNGFVTRNPQGAKITPNGLIQWVDTATVVSVYFYLQQPSIARLSLMAKGHSEIKVSYGRESFDVKLDSEGYTKVPVGMIDVKEPGYVRIDLQGVSKNGDRFGRVKELLLDGVTSACNYVKDFSDYWGRRGPSVHMAYTLPKGDT